MPVAVMLRLEPEEHERLRAAWATSHVDEWKRLPFARWCKRTLLNIFPEKPSATARTLPLFDGKLAKAKPRRHK